MKLDHIGIVVEDLLISVDYYTKLYKTSIYKHEYIEPAHGVKIVFLNAGEGVSTKIELICPIDEKSKVHNFLKKTGGGFHHTAFTVNNLSDSIKEFQKLNSIILGKPNPAAGHQNKPSIWIYNRTKSLIELIED